jgi:hypothetical protein
MDTNNSTSTENKNPTGDQPSTPPPAEQDWHELRRAARQARREARYQWRGQNVNINIETMHGGGWFLGVVLIILGIVFLLSNIFALPLHNWWALFLLIPAFSGLRGAWYKYQTAGQLNWMVWRSVLGGLFWIFLTVVFLINLSWGLLLPVLLILFGLGILADRALRK